MAFHILFIFLDFECILSIILEILKKVCWNFYHLVITLNVNILVNSSNKVHFFQRWLKNKILGFFFKYENIFKFSFPAFVFLSTLNVTAPALF